jgi:SAM-dependent methyltransferase
VAVPTPRTDLRINGQIRWFVEKMKPLKPEEDAFGQMIWALHNGQEVFEVIERDDNYIDAMSAEGYFSAYQEWPQFERSALELAKGRVLDVGSGAGRHSLHLQEKGLDVTGIDVSPLALKVCKLRGLRKTRLMSVYDVSFKPDSFDTIIMMGNNFGLFASFNKAKRLLRKFHKITSNNGMIVADTRDPYKTDNPMHLAYHKRNRERNRMGGQVKIRVRYRTYVGRWFDYLMVSKEEMKQILKDTGWQIKEFIDPQNGDTSRYLAVMVKAT